jgi:ketosteroid isomerase-like protein
VPTAAEQTLTRFADAVTRGVAEDAVAECHPDVSFSSVLASVDGEPFRGHDGIRRYFETVLGTLEEWRVELHRVTEVPDGRLAVTMTMHVRGRASGVALSQPVGHVWELQDGKLWRCTPFADPADALAEAGLT